MQEIRSSEGFGDFPGLYERERGVCCDDDDGGDDDTFFYSSRRVRALEIILPRGEERGLSLNVWPGEGATQRRQTFSR